MAGWGGAEGPGTPITEKEGTGCGRAIGVQDRGDPPPCVTSLPTAHFQATGRGREEDVGCPGKWSYLPVGWCCLAWGLPGGQLPGRVSRIAEGEMLEAGGGAGTAASLPAEPGVLLRTLLLSKLWHSLGLERCECHLWSSYGGRRRSGGAHGGG